MRRVITLTIAGVLLGVVSCGQAVESSNTPASSSALTIPYVASRNDIVRDLLWLADVATNDIVFDLGSGDGRVVIAAVRDFGARRAVGIELDEQRHAASVRAAQEAGVADRVQFIRGDLFTNDLSEASVVVLYLGHEANLRLRPTLLRTLKPGSRIVSHQYGMGEWRPNKQLKIHTPYLGMFGLRVGPFHQNPNVPDFRITDIASFTTLSMWAVPAPAAGVWRGGVQMQDGPAELQLQLQQSIGEVSGSFRIQGPTSVQGRNIGAELWGSQLRLECVQEGRPYGAFRLMMDGRVTGDTLSAQLAIFDGAGVRQVEWVARRDKSEITGVWAWPAVDDSGNLTLRIGRQDGRLTAAYADARQSLTIGDVYDFGGGFYFTAMLGREEVAGGGTRYSATEGCGWVLGEGVVVGSDLRGRLSLFPYEPHLLRQSHPLFGAPSAETNRSRFSEVPGVIRDWNARRAGP